MHRSAVLVFPTQLAKPEPVKRVGISVKACVLVDGHSWNTQTGALRDKRAVLKAEFLSCNALKANCIEKRLVNNSSSVGREEYRDTER